MRRACGEPGAAGAAGTESSGSRSRRPLRLVGGGGGLGPRVTARADGDAGADGLEAALADDLEGTFERLVRVYQDRLFAFALRLAGRREDAEEIAQDAFVRAYRALGTYAPERIRALALRAWLYRIALNVARNRFRRKRPVTVSIDAAATRADGGERVSIDPAADAEERPDRVYEKRRARADLASLVQNLPDRYRAPILLRYVEGLPVEEVASILRQPVGTAKSNLHRGVNALRNALSASRSARTRPLEVSR
jgi:RNA polymerase sigma-70 factor, ECF subfamily